MHVVSPGAVRLSSSPRRRRRRRQRCAKRARKNAANAKTHAPAKAALRARAAEIKGGGKHMPVRKRTARSTSAPDTAVEGQAAAQGEPALTTANGALPEKESGTRKIMTRARMALLMMGGFLFIVFGYARNTPKL